MKTRTALKRNKYCARPVTTGKLHAERRPEWAAALIKEGEEKGFELGEMRGLRLGVIQAKRDTALRMLRRGMATSEVAELVDLPEEEVLRLAKEAIN